MRLIVLALLLSAAPCGAAGGSFHGKTAPRTFAEIPPLDMSYASARSRALTVTILGSSKGTELLKPHMDLASLVSKQLVLRGYNVLTGCGNAGILGCAYAGAVQGRDEALKSGLSPGENLAIVVTPPWGDENLHDARAIGIADSESARLEKFHQVSDHFLVFPGGPATLQEAATLIAKNHYRGKDPKKSILVIGKDFFDGLLRQYETLHGAGLLKERPDELFRLVESADEILASFPARR